MSSLIHEPGTSPSEIWGVKVPENDTTITVRWYRMGSEFTYNVWHAARSEGPWIKHNETRLYDAILAQNEETYTVHTYNNYTIDGLDDNKVYYTKVTCIDKYNSWWVGYQSTESVGGGLGHKEDAPLSPFDNYIGFKINIL